MTTSPIRLDRRREPFRLTVGAMPDVEHVRVLEPRLVEVRVDVDAEPVDRKFTAVPVELTSSPHDCRPAQLAVDVVVSGPPRVVDRLAPDQVRAVADVSDLVPARELQRVPLRIRFTNLPERETARLGVESVSRRTVSVRVSARTNEP